MKPGYLIHSNPIKTKSAVLLIGVTLFVLPAVTMANPPGFVQLPDDPGYAQTYANAINNLGTIAGGAALNPPGVGGPVTSYLYSGGSFQNFNVTPEDESTAYGLNNSNQVVGGYSFGQSYEWNAGAVTFISPAFAVLINTYGINDAGVVVGNYYSTYPGPTQGLIDKGGNFTTYDVAGADSTTLTGINNKGEMVGYYTVGTNTIGFLTDSNGVITVTIPGENAQGVNDYEQVVGYMGNSGFVYSGGSNVLISVDGAMSTRVNGINDNGTMVGTFSTSSTSHGFTATIPVPSHWITKASIPTGLWGPTAVALDNQLYLLGGDAGINSDAANTLVQVYNPRTDSWSNSVSLPAGRYFSEAAVLSNQICFIGGWTHSPPLPNSTLWFFNPSSGSWNTTAGASLPSLNADGVAGLISNKLYVTTPDNGYSGFRNWLFAYDPGSNQWVQLASSSLAHSDAAGGVINGKLYVAGGVDDADQIINTTEVYDPVSNNWTTVSPMPTARAGVASAIVGGRLYAMGGWDGTNYLNTVEIYDPVNDTWTSGPPLLTARGYATACVINWTIYVAAGVNSTTTHLTNLEALSVAPTPPLISAQISNNAVNLAWNSVPGQSYQLQYSTNLTQSDWIDLNNPIIATNINASVSDSLTSPQRFYRLLLIP